MWKTWKSIFWQAFGARSTQTLVEIHNNQGFRMRGMGKHLSKNTFKEYTPEKWTRLIFVYGCTSSIQLLFWRKLVQQQFTNVKSFSCSLKNEDVGYCGKLSEVRESIYLKYSSVHLVFPNRYTAYKMMSRQCVIAKQVSTKKQLYTTVNSNESWLWMFRQMAQINAFK